MNRAALPDAAKQLVDIQAKLTDEQKTITYIRWLYRGRQVKGWTGPGSKVVTEDGSAWIPYQEANVVSPPFAEYTSGHSAFSGAAQRVFNLVAGTDSFRLPCW